MANAFKANKQIELKYPKTWLFIQKALEALYYESDHHAMVLSVKWTKLNRIVIAYEFSK